MDIALQETMLQLMCTTINIIMLSQGCRATHHMFHDVLQAKRQQHFRFLQHRIKGLNILTDDDALDLFRIDFNDHDGYTQDMALKYGPLDCPQVNIHTWPPQFTGQYAIIDFTQDPLAFHQRTNTRLRSQLKVPIRVLKSPTPHRPTPLNAMSYAYTCNQRVTFSTRFLFRMNPLQRIAWALDLFTNKLQCDRRLAQVLLHGSPTSTSSQ